MKFTRPVLKSALIAHVLAWGVFLFLALWPSAYTGTTTTPIQPDGSGGEVVPYSASMIEVNGWGVLVPLLAPVALTAAGLVIVLVADNGTFTSKFLMWTVAVLLIVFCGLAMFSLGIFYLPSALALLAAAIVMSTTSKPIVSQTPNI